MLEEKEMVPQKKKRGRHPQGKSQRTWTIHDEIAHFFDSYPEGIRSHYVNEQLARNPDFQASELYEQWKKRTGREE